MPKQQLSGRKLRLNHSNALPRYIIAYDTETLPTKVAVGHNNKSHRFRLGVAITARIKDTRPTAKQTHRCHSPADFWKLLDRFTASNYTTWVICHNTLFDMVVTGLPQKFEESKLVIEWPRSDRVREDNNDGNAHARTLAIIDSPPTIIACKYVPTGGRVVFVDTCNWFAVRLATLGDHCGLPKKEMPSFDQDQETWFDYCERDAEIVFRTFTQLIEWHREQDFGMFRYTAPSQAMSAYRHRFMDFEIAVHDNDDAKALERKAYLGGRTQVFKAGKINTTVHQIDVNSLFPSVMLRGKFPRMLRLHELEATQWSEQNPPDWENSVVEVVIETDEPLYPVRGKHGIFYPIGRFVTTLCGPELSVAASKGSIVGVRRWCHYATDAIFERWVTELWNMRVAYKQSGNALYSEFAKRLMNSLYGKFGQRSPNWVNVPGEAASLPWSQWTRLNAVTGERKVYRSFGWQVQEHCDKGEINGTFVAVSAFVASAARVRMNQMRKLAGYENVYYQGVDSLIVTSAGLERLRDADLIAEDELGKFRIQLSTDHGEIVGSNDYTVGQKQIVAGRCLTNETLPDGRTFQRTFAVDKALFNGISTDKILEEWVSWDRQHPHIIGNVGQDGWVSPLVMTTPVTGSIDGVSDDAAMVDALASTMGVNVS